MDKEHEEQMINNFRAEMEAKIREKERQQQEEKNERIKEKKAEEKKLEQDKVRIIWSLLYYALFRGARKALPTNP